MQRKRARLRGEEEEEGGRNISYVFGEEVVLDLTFLLAHRAATRRRTRWNERREDEPLGEGSSL